MKRTVWRWELSGMVFIISLCANNDGTTLLGSLECNVVQW